MGLLTIKISDDLEREFRALAFSVFGYRKESLSKAAEEAIRLWIRVRKGSLVEDVIKEINAEDEEKVRNLLKALGVL